MSRPLGMLEKQVIFLYLFRPIDVALTGLPQEGDHEEDHQGSGIVRAISRAGFSFRFTFLWMLLISL